MTPRVLSLIKGYVQQGVKIPEQSPTTWARQVHNESSTLGIAALDTHTLSLPGYPGLFTFLYFYKFSHWSYGSREMLFGVYITISGSTAVPPDVWILLVLVWH